jgi:hypothetical protein
MRRLIRAEGGVTFRGSVDGDDDLAVAAGLASQCGAYRRDDEDEDPVSGALSCFGCRYRRWVPDGFTCMKDLLEPAT